MYLLRANQIIHSPTMKWIVSLIVFLLLFVSAFFIVKVHSSAIVSGEPTEENEFPFMAALGWINNDTGKADYLCGGVLISSHFVLTAAHCVFFDGRVPDIIQIGGNQLNSGENENHTVNAHFIHPEYNSTQAYNDLALLKLNKRSWKRLVMIWNKFLDFTATAIGYGTTQFAGTKSNALLKVNLQIVSQKQCQQFFGRKRKFKSGISPSHICAGDPEGRKDTCQGDSGGPLLIYSVFVVGITSVGQACAGNPPSVYTRVPYFTDWINGIIKYKEVSRISSNGSSFYLIEH